MDNTQKAAPVSLIVFLVITGIILIGSRIIFTKEDTIPAGDTVWLLNIRTDFTTAFPQATLQLSPPYNTPFARVISQNFMHPGLNVRKPTASRAQKRNISIVAQDPGEYYLDTEFQIHFSPVARWTVRPTTPLSAENRQKYLDQEDGIQINDDYLRNTFNVLTKEHMDQNMLLKRIFYFVYKNISVSKSKLGDDALTTIKKAEGTVLGRARTMIALCRIGNLPARLVTGFIFQHPVRDRPYHWVEVYIDDKWQPFDPVNGHSGSLPPSYIPVSKEKPAIITASTKETLKDFSIQYELSQQDLPRGMLKGRKKQISDVFDLSRLSLGMQTTLATLFLLPLGVLFTTFTKNFIGIRSYGTFTPTLLALAAVYTNWFTAVMIFSLVAIFGVGGRYFLAGSKITRATRLSVVFTLAAISMALGVSILDYYQFSAEGHVVLLPIVILTTLVDRIYTVADETGIRNSIIRLAWTVVVGLGCFLILIQEYLGYFFLEFPEAHLITIAMILMSGLHKGKKFMELRYVRLLTETKAENTRTTK